MACSIYVYIVSFKRTFNQTVMNFFSFIQSSAIKIRLQIVNNAMAENGQKRVSVGYLVHQVKIFLNPRSIRGCALACYVVVVVVVEA